MERMTSWARPRGMTNQSRIRGLATAGLLCAALAGCGTAVATAAPTTTPPTTVAPAAPGAQAARTVPEVGCASVNQATTVTVERNLLVPEPLGGATGIVIQRKARLVRALFRDFCAAVTHPEIPRPPLFCPANFGVYYTGTFFDEQRVLATFIYGIGGCPHLSLTAAGTTRTTLVLGTAAAAAPHLEADFAAVLGQPEPKVYGPPRQGQANQPARQSL